MDINKVTGNSIENINKAKSNAEKVISRQPENGDNENLETALTADNAQNIVDTLNSAAKSIDKKVSFSFHEGTQRVIMHIIDGKTNEVIRDIPPKELLRLLEHIHDMMGVFIDESR